MLNEWYMPLLAFGLAWWLTRMCCDPGSVLYFLDHPNERSLHVRPTPRTGGVGVMGGVLGAGLVLGLVRGFAPSMWAVLGGAFGLAVLNLVDDRSGLPARVRFAAQALAALVFLGLADLPGPGWGLLPAFLGLVWMANLYNFMDGSDGLAGGMAVFGFGACGLGAALGGDMTLALLCASIAAAAGGFLCFNFHPARIFMGDVGSVPLGYMAAGLGLYGWQQGLWPLWFPLAVFSPFCADATVTLLRRAWRGEKIWLPHRTHYYQRLVQLGWGHRRTALFAYGLMCACGVGALVILHFAFPVQIGVITIGCIAYCIIGVLVDQAWRRHQNGPT
ncbi:MAG: glycosyltransferase family 4 protein [Rhodocyclales bacterium]|nr:glycosyltransferase family 4 protein [Rhodocyclales bacterium]